MEKTSILSSNKKDFLNNLDNLNHFEKEEEFNYQELLKKYIYVDNDFELYELSRYINKYIDNFTTRTNSNFKKMKLGYKSEYEQVGYIAKYLYNECKKLTLSQSYNMVIKINQIFIEAKSFKNQDIDKRIEILKKAIKDQGTIRNKKAFDNYKTWQDILVFNDL